MRILAGDDPGGPGFREEVVPAAFAGEYPGRLQPIRPGSYVRITPPEAGRARLDALASFTLHAMVLPTVPPRGRRAIMGRWSEPEQTGYLLVLAEDGSAGLRLGGPAGGLVSTGVALAPGRWAQLVATYDAGSGEACVRQRPLAAGVAGALTGRPAAVRRAVAGGSPHTSAPFLFAAWSDGAGTGGHFNGKIDAPRLLDRALSLAEALALGEPSPAPGVAERVVGWWDFSRGIASDHVEDCSASALCGETVQLPARAVTGWNWTGEEPCWRHAPEQYGAIHFHDDDLADAGWATDFTLTVPEGLPSGVYAARLRPGGDPGGDGADEHVVFFVRPPRGVATADVAFLAPTASYLAYANYRLRLRPNPIFGSQPSTALNDRYLEDHPEVGASLYDRHGDWSGVHFSSRHRPLLNLRPRHNRIWGFPADAGILAWLEHEGVRYDILTDEDLHAEGPALLERYRVVLTGSHPEYHSTRMLDAIETYLGGGGRLMYLGGNGFYWRIAFHPSRPGIIEVRRAEDGTRAWMAEPGEYYHAFNGEYGGLWRRLGRPPNRTVGVGFAAQGFERSSYYRKGPGADDPRAAFVFAGVPEAVIGDFGSLGGGAAGEEIDRHDVRLGSPRHALVLASSEAHDAAMLRTKEEFLSTVLPFKDPKVRADMVFFECPQGGAVFATGSIAWAGALAHAGYANNVARITGNVLARFRDPTPFADPTEPSQ